MKSSTKSEYFNPIFLWKNSEFPYRAETLIIKIESTLKNRQNLLPPRNTMKGPRINLKIAQTSARSGMESSPFMRAKEYDKSLTRKVKLPGLSPTPKAVSSKPLMDNVRKNLNRIKYLEKAHRYVRRRNILSRKSHSKRVKIRQEKGKISFCFSSHMMGDECIRTSERILPVVSSNDHFSHPRVW